MVGNRERHQQINRYELGPNELLEYIGLRNSNAVKSRLRDISNLSFDQDQLIPEWGITLEQFSRVVKALKPKIKPKKFFTDRLGDEFRVELAAIEFIRAWKNNESEDDEIIFVDSTDILKASKILSLYREINTHVIPEFSI